LEERFPEQRSLLRRFINAEEKIALLGLRLRTLNRFKHKIDELLTRIA
jgi:hypothetical protein